MIEYRLVGNWRGAARALAMLPYKVKLAAKQGERQASRELVRIVKGHINNQDLGWAARSPKTHSHDPRILVDTKAYYKAINVWESQGVTMVGVNRNSFDSKGRRISDYAILHENGTVNMPARPLWKPSLKEMGGPNAIRNLVLLKIYEKLFIMRAQGFDVDFKL